MTINKCYLAQCDVCENTWEYSYKNTKASAIKEFRNLGWKIGKKIICTDCVARKTRICPKCSNKMIEKEGILVCNICHHFIII